METRSAIKPTIIVRMMDSFHGKRTTGLPFQENRLDTVMSVARQGHDRCGLAASVVLGLSCNPPFVVEAVADRALVLPLLPRIREIVGPEGKTAVAGVEVV